MKHGVRKALRDVLRTIVGTVINRHVPDPSRKDIFIFFTRRSGSTWLTETLAMGEGMRAVQDPLLLRDIPPRYATSLLGGKDRFFHTLTGAEEALMREYFDRLLAGRLHAGTPWNVFDETFHVRTSRNVVKLTNAHGLMNWFEVEFSVHPVLLVRHPIATALSQVNHPTMTPQTSLYTANEWLMDQLNAEQHRTIQQIGRQTDVLRRHVLDWCLENVVPLLILERSNRLIVPFEDLVLRGEAMLDYLDRALDLPSVEAMRQRLDVPSKTSSPSLKREAQEGDPEHVLRRWKRHISDTDATGCMRIVESFGLDGFYRDGEDGPVWSPLSSGCGS